MTVLDDRPEEFSWATKVPAILGPWAQAAHSSATSVSHIDYGGMGTWMHISVGEKLCFIGSGKKGSEGTRKARGVKGAGETLKASLTTAGVFDDGKLHWSPEHLLKGDDLYVPLSRFYEAVNLMHMSRRFLRPGTPFHVIATKDCITTGGHFFSSSHFTRTLETIIVEHFTAGEATEPEHTKVHIVLFKVLRKYYHDITSHRTLFFICDCPKLTFAPLRTAPKRQAVRKSHHSMCRHKPAAAKDPRRCRATCMGRHFGVYYRPWVRCHIREEDGGVASGS